MSKNVSFLNFVDEIAIAANKYCLANSVSSVDMKEFLNFAPSKETINEILVGAIASIR